MTLKEKLISTTFISWAPLVFYLSTGVSSSWRTRFLGKAGYDDFGSIFLIAIYLGFVTFLSPKIEKLVNSFTERHIAPKS